jgi:hypothetical protein
MCFTIQADASCRMSEGAGYRHRPPQIFRSGRKSLQARSPQFTFGVLTVRGAQPPTYAPQRGASSSSPGWLKIGGNCLLKSDLSLRLSAQCALHCFTECAKI